MDDVIHGHIRSELVARRQRLESALAIDFVREAGFRHIALFSRRRPRYVPI